MGVCASDRKGGDRERASGGTGRGGSGADFFRLELDRVIGRENDGKPTQGENGEESSDNLSLPKSEIARNELSRELNVHFSDPAVLARMWGAYAKRTLDLPLHKQTMNLEELRMIVGDVLRVDLDYDLILQERHMTGEKSASSGIFNQNPAADNADIVRLRNSSGAYEGFKTKRYEKTDALLSVDHKTGNISKKFYNLGKKVFRELDGKPSKKTQKKTIEERPVTRAAFISKFKLDLILDEIKIR